MLINNLLCELYSTDWSGIEISNDPNIGYETFVDIFTSMCNKHTVERHITNRGKKFNPKKPWITKGIITSIVKNQKLYHKFINGPLQQK